MEAHEQLLRERGHEVRLLEAHNREIASAGSEFEAAAGCFYSRKWSARVRREIAEFRPDVAHVHNVFPLLSPGVISACKSAGVPVVQTLHNYRLMCPAGTLYRDGKICEDCVGRLYPWPGVVHACYRGSRLGTAVVGAGIMLHRGLRTYAKQVDCFAVLTDFARAKFAALPLPAERFRKLPNWTSQDPGMGEGKGGFFLFAGRLTPEKGIATLLAAWSKLPSGMLLKIAGAGPMEDAVRRAAAASSSIEYLGFQPAETIHGLMRQATGVLLPSQWYEGLPLTLVESFATGTPVIASRLGGLAELVSEGRTGWLFPACDAAALAAAIEQAAANPAGLAAMRREARNEYEAHYSAECAYRGLMELYATAIARRGEKK